MLSATQPALFSRVGSGTVPFRLLAIVLFDAMRPMCNHVL